MAISATQYPGKFNQREGPNMVEIPVWNRLYEQVKAAQTEGIVEVRGFKKMLRAIDVPEEVWDEPTTPEED